MCTLIINKFNHANVQIFKLCILHAVELLFHDVAQKVKYYGLKRGQQFDKKNGNSGQPVIKVNNIGR